ncbi:DUF2283 domain-containing protein [Microcystis aeruginosa]
MKITYFQDTDTLYLEFNNNLLKRRSRDDSIIIAFPIHKR